MSSGARSGVAATRPRPRARACEPASPSSACLRSSRSRTRATSPLCTSSTSWGCATWARSGTTAPTSRRMCSTARTGRQSVRRPGPVLALRRRSCGMSSASSRRPERPVSLSALDGPYTGCMSAVTSLRPLRGLRFDLSNGHGTEEELPVEAARAFLGGRGLGALIALRERLYEVEPLAPENLLVFAPGPLTGTGAPASGRYSVTSRSPLTGTVFDGNSGGNWGNAFRRLGYDYLIVGGVLRCSLVSHRRRARGRAAAGRRALGPRRAGLARAAARAARGQRGRRHRPGRRARRAVRVHRQQPWPVDRARRAGRRHGGQAPQGGSGDRGRRTQARRGRPGQAGVRRLRGRQAAEGQPDHVAGASRVRHLGARQCARSGRRPAHAQLQGVAVRTRAGDLG